MSELYFTQSDRKGGGFVVDNNLSKSESKDSDSGHRSKIIALNDFTLLL